MNSDDQDTRDIAVETRADVRALKETVAAYITESREHRDRQEERHRCIEKKIEPLTALANEAKGASIASKGIFAVIAAGAGVLGSMAHALLGGSPPPAH